MDNLWAINDKFVWPSAAFIFVELTLIIKEQGQHQFIADIDLVLLLILLIQSLFYLLS